VPDLQRLHLGRAARLAARFDHRRNLIVHPHERQRPRRPAAARQLFTARANRRQVRPCAGAELEQHGLAAGQPHNVFHVVFDALDEARRRLRMLVGVLRLDHAVAALVVVPGTPIARDPVLVIQAHVEPHGRIERAVLVQAQPRQLAIKPLAVGLAGKIPVLPAPVGDRSRHAMNQLPHAPLPLPRAVLAVEVLADDHVRRQLAPRSRNLAVGLLEQDVAVFVLDRRRTQLPFDGFQWVLDVHGAENTVHAQPGASFVRGTGFRRENLRGNSFRNSCHGQLLLQAVSIRRNREICILHNVRRFTKRVGSISVSIEHELGRFRKNGIVANSGRDNVNPQHIVSHWCDDHNMLGRRAV